MELSIKELFKQAKSGSLKMHSAMGTRDEAKQVRQFSTKVKKMKTQCGLNERVLVMKDVVLPFNPFTCLPDDIYNKKTPYRPILLVSQTIELIKSAIAEDAELAEKYEKILGGRLSEGTEVTYEDYLIFKHAGFIRPRIMSYYTVKINFAGRNGFPEFATRYTVDESELNEDKNYDYDTAPVHAKLTTLFSSICREEWLAKQEILTRDAVPQEQQDAERRNIFAKNPIGFVSPYNVIPFIMNPLDSTFPAINAEDPDEIEDSLRYYNKTDKWVSALEDVTKDDSSDELIDFYEFTVKTPSSGTPTSTGKVITDDDPNAIYQMLTISVTDGRKTLRSMGESVNFKQFYDALKKYFIEKMTAESEDGDGKGFEQIIATSTRCRPITSVSDKILSAANEVFNASFASSPYFTDKIKKANADILTAMNPKNALITAAYDDEEIKEATVTNFSDMNKFLKETNDGEEELQDIDLGTEPEQQQQNAL